MASNLYDIKRGKKDSVVDFINCKFKEQRENMQDQYRNWMLNLAWTRGYQNADFNRTTRNFQDYNEKNPWKVRLISNMMLPIVRRLVSQTTHQKPVWDVIPATPDEFDIQISETGRKTLWHYWQTLNMNQKIIRLAFWMHTCSSAFFKVGWDADAGDEVTVQAKDVERDLLASFMEMVGLQQSPEQLTVNKGDAFIDICTPFNITLAPDAAVMDDSEWIIESNIRSTDWIVNKFGNKWKKLTETDSNELFLYPSILGQRKGTLNRKGVLTHEIHIRKGKKFPKGLYCFAAGNEVIITPKDCPYEHGDLPYAHFVEIYDPASLWGTCVAEQVRPNQARYNRINSGVMEQINLMSNVQWLNPTQSGVKTFTNKPGQPINYNAPYAPTQLTPKPIPAYVERMLDRTRMDMQDTASSHDVTEGKAEPGIRSGRAVLSLQDADDGILGPVLSWFDESLGRTGKLLLQTITQYIDEERVATITGEFNEITTVSFSQEMLQGASKGGDYWKVRVKTAGRQAMSRSGRESLTRVLMEFQLLNPQLNREEILHILGVSDFMSVYDKNTVNYTRQYKEILLLIQQPEQPIIVMMGESHQAHIDSIKKYISSSLWDKLELPQKQAIEQHLIMHMQKQIEEAAYPQAYLQATMGQQGKPNA